MSQYVYNGYCLDTTPGSSSPFSPPSGWSGNGDDFTNWLRRQYKSDHSLRQKLFLAARDHKFGKPLVIQGAYRDAFLVVLKMINSKEAAQQRENQ